MWRFPADDLSRSAAIEAGFAPGSTGPLVVADFHIGDRGVGMETDAHLLPRYG
jgi:hypothetical protein